MMPRRRVGRVLALVAIASAGCSLAYSSELNDARGIQAPGVSDRRDGGGDSATDGDGATAVGGDAGDAGDDAGAARGCAAMQPSPRYCRDFDDNAPLESGGWTIDINPPGKQFVELDTSSGYSTPASLVTKLANAPSCSYGRLVRAFPEVSSRVELRVRLRPTGPWRDTDGVMITHFDDDSASPCAAILYLQAGADGLITSAAVNMQTPGTNDLRPLNGFAPVDEWTELGMVATRVDAGISLVVSFRREDGTYSEAKHVFSQCKLAGTTRVKLGWHCENGNGEMHYDDFGIDW